MVRSGKKMYIQNCDPCYRCGNFAHYYLDHFHTTFCANCLWYMYYNRIPDNKIVNIWPIPYATYNPWLYEDYYKDYPEQLQIFRNLMIINGFEEVDKYIWKRVKDVQGDTYTQEG